MRESEVDLCRRYFGVMLGSFFIDGGMSMRMWIMGLCLLLAGCGQSGHVTLPSNHAPVMHPAGVIGRTAY